jgi:4-hydroxy-3-polyprenylbenzoate decarboxylase
LPAPDLQSFVIELEQRGWLRRIRAAVDPVLEITEITDRVTKAGGPSLLFENVKGSSIPVLINTFGTRERMCLALGADSLEEIAERVKLIIKPEIPTTLIEKLKKIPQLMQLGSLPPKVVSRGICQEVVHREDADLTTLPALKCWPQDGDLSWMVNDGPARELWKREFGAAEPAERALPDTTPQDPRPRVQRSHVPTEGVVPGRYLTLTNVFTKNPETGERNIGMYRVQIFGPKLAAMHWHTHHDGARHYRIYKRLGRRMPVAVSFGGAAVMPYAATCPLPPGIDECLFAGFLNGGPIELVACVSQPEIEVPATAEIVVEGYIDPQEPPILEGPFGDHTGFYSMADLFPRFRITAITHRKNPIYPTTVVGKPPQEDFWLGKATERIFLPLLKTIVPDIIDYNLPMFGCFHNCAFIKIRKEYPQQARRVMSAIWGAGQMAFTKMIVVVDESVDVQDEQAVLFHMLANCDPRRDCMIIDGPLDILDHAAPHVGAGSKIGWDATRKIAGEGAVRTYPAEIEMSEEIRRLVSGRWREYGI